MTDTIKSSRIVIVGFPFGSPSRNEKLLVYFYYTSFATASLVIRNKNQESDLWEHCRKKHDGNLTRFRMDVIETFKQDPLLRQITEAVRINRTDKKKIINKKEEFGTARYL